MTMKKIILLLIILSITSTVCYADYFEVSQVRIYVNNERYNDNGNVRDIFVMPGDTLDINLLLSNNRAQTIQSKIYSDIKYIDSNTNLVREISYFDIAPNDQRSKTLSYIIPNNAVYDDYPLRITIYNKNANITETSFNMDYVVYVKKKGTASLTSDEAMGVIAVSMNTTLKNFSKMYNGMISTLGVCYTELNRSRILADKLSTCKESLGNNVSILNDKIKDYATVVTEYDEYKKSITDNNAQYENKLLQMRGELDTAKTQMSGMLTQYQCSNITNSEVEKIRKSNNNFMFMIAGAGVVIYFVVNNKKKNKSVADGINWDRGG